MNNKHLLKESIKQLADRESKTELQILEELLEGETSVGHSENESMLLDIRMEWLGIE